MPYKITIERTRIVRKTVPKRWVLCGREGELKMDYSPEVETVAEETENIYEQKVDALDVLGVISAVNNNTYPEK